jgi:RNA polymerase sigma-70 factor (ECF subfamily)
VTALIAMASDQSTSVTLLERLRGRDEQAWGRLVHLYAPLVYHWCQRAGVPAQDVADLQQEVFAAVAAGLDGFRRDRPEDTFRGWLRGIMRHKLVDYRRRRSSQPAAVGGTTVQRLLQETPEPELLDEPAEQINGLFLRAVELVRGEFEAKTWTAFWRAAVDGHAPAVIAADLNTTAMAVRKAKSRVLHRLRQEIGDLID